MQGDVSISITISHHNQIFNFLIVEVGSVELSVTSEQLLFGQGSSLVSVQIVEDLLKLNCFVHGQEMADQVAKSSLLDLVFARERLQIGQSSVDGLTSL